MRIIYAIMLFLVVSYQAFSQSAKLSQNIPNSPEAMSFAKYGIIPVTLYSGMPNVSIPLYTIQDGDLEVPISLSYYSKGFKPAEIANNTGLGWSLQPGGMITRIVRGQVDENPEMTIPDNYYGVADLKMKFEDFPDISQQRYSQRVLSEVATGVSDGEPDLYSFNFNGYSGYFIVRNGEAILTPKQNLKINVIPTFSGNTFSIITENGTLYMFGDGGTEKTQPTDYHQTQPVYIKRYTSAWHLTSILSFDRIHSISFLYDSVRLDREDAISGAYTLSSEDGGYPTGSYTTSVNYGASITSMVIKNITTLSGNCKVSFNKGLLRDDVKDYLGQPTLRNLGNIVVETQNGVFIKKWIFDYNYFGTITNKKLKLIDLYQVDINGNSLNRHSFNYFNETTGLPPHDTKGIDHWGYFNGITNNGCIIPAELCPNGTMVGVTPGIRTPNEIYSINTVLSKIIYPTGGYTTFDYEPNRFSVNDGSSNFETTQQTVDLYATYNSQNAVWDIDNYYVKTAQSFSICVDQNVNFYYRFVMPGATSRSTGAKIFYPVFRIRKIWNVCDDGPSINPNTIVYQKTGQFYPIDDIGTYEISETLHLAPGTYVAEIKIDSYISTIYASLGYLSTDGSTIKPGDKGPGLRIARITNYDSDGLKATEKKYEYVTDQGTSSGVGGGLQYNVSSYVEEIVMKTSSRFITHKTISGELEQNVGSLLNEKFYYTKVTEYNVGKTSYQKSDYYFWSFDDVNGGVKLIKQVDFKNVNGKYYKINAKEYDYESTSEDKYIMCLNSEFVGKKVSGELWAYILPYLNYDDPLDPIQHLEFYSGSSPTIPVAFLKLIKETEKSYVYNLSSSTFADSLITEKKYKYSPSTPFNPCEIEQSTSSNKSVISNTKYSYNYNLLNSSINTPDKIKSAYDASLINIINKFDQYRNTDILAFKKYYNSYDSLRDKKAIDITAYNTAIQTQIQSEGDPNKKAILIMQRDHDISTSIEQQHYQKVNSVKKFLGAEKTVFGVNGVNVENKEVWTYELITPIDSVSYNSSNFKKRLEKKHNYKMNLTNQKLTDDIDHSYIWGYNNTLLIAETKNAGVEESDYTGFENHEAPGWSTSGWNYTDNISNVKTGKTAIASSGGGPAKYFTVGMSAGKHSGYKASIWVKGGTDAFINIQINDDNTISKRVTNANTKPGSWNLIAVELPYILYKTKIDSNMRIKVYCSASGMTYFDDLRFYPMDAQMTTYTYDPLIGITSSSDVNNKSTTYKYDTFGRLILVYDYLGNILKKYDYHYKQ